MTINPFSYHEQALNLRAMRSEILSSNIANADTPNFKARDINFADALQKVQGQNVQSTQVSMRKTNPLHQSGVSTNRLGAEIMYRVPTQSTLDGNTVETDVEQAQWAENTMRYEASLTFLSGQIKGLRYAIQGGD